jgi:hypothetical protein
MWTPARRRLLLVLLVGALAAAVLAPGALAKGVTGLTVCGQDGCVDRTKLVAAALADPDSRLGYDVMQGEFTVADPGPARFVRFRQHIGHDGEDIGSVKTVYFPDLGIQLFEDGTYHSISAASRPTLDRLVAGIRPFPASALGVRHVQDAAPAADVTPAAAAPSDGGGGASGGGGPSAAAWIGAAAAAGVGLFIMMALWRRRGRPATG